MRSEPAISGIAHHGSRSRPRPHVGAATPVPQGAWGGRCSSVDASVAVVLRHDVNPHQIPLSQEA